MTKYSRQKPGSLPRKYLIFSKTHKITDKVTGKIFSATVIWSVAYGTFRKIFPLSRNKWLFFGQDRNLYGARKKAIKVRSDTYKYVISECQLWKYLHISHSYFVSSSPTCHVVNSSQNVKILQLGLSCISSLPTRQLPKFMLRRTGRNVQYIAKTPKNMQILNLRTSGGLPTRLAEVYAELNR